MRKPRTEKIVPARTGNEAPARRKYGTAAPIIAAMMNDDTRDEYLRMLRAAEVRTVFLVAEKPVAELRPLTDEEIRHIAKEARFLKKNGFETAIWTGGSIGHGGPRVPVEEERGAAYRPLVTAGGEAVRTTRCPLDANFRKALAQSVRGYIATGVRTIVYDDDYRINQHSPEPCCCCDEHLALMSETLGYKVTREEVRASLRGKPNPVRTAFLKAQAEGLRLLSADLRAAADEVDPKVRLAVCSAWSPWDLDEADPIGLSRILAGKHPALLRLHGAPYWKDHWGNYPLAMTIETERMFASFCAGREDLRIISEGDCWPRPRYRTASAPLEIFDAALRAAGTTDGILKYLFDYTTSPFYEQGYVDRHVRDLKLLEKIRIAFECAAPEGLRVCVYPHKFETADLPADFDLALLNQWPYASGYVLAASSVPAVYEGSGTGGALVFGENARKADMSLLEKGGIVDATAAQILTERGLDLGIRKVVSYEKENVAWECFCGGERISVGRSNGAAVPTRLLRAGYADGVRAESAAETADGEVPLTYRYENAKGQRFLVLAFSAEEQEPGSVLFRHYARGRQMRDAAEWIAGKRLPATSDGNPDLLIIAARKRDALFVGVFNCFWDSVIRPVIRLDRAYSKIREHMGSRVRLEGDKAILSELPAYGFAYFAVQ